MRGWITSQSHTTFDVKVEKTDPAFKDRLYFINNIVRTPPDASRMVWNNPMGGALEWAFGPENAIVDSTGTVRWYLMPNDDMYDPEQPYKAGITLGFQQTADGGLVLGYGQRYAKYDMLGCELFNRRLPLGYADYSHAIDVSQNGHMFLTFLRPIIVPHASTITTPDRLDIFHLRFLLDFVHTRKLGATAQNFDMSTTASRMLQRLRDAFDDPLFVRGPTGLTPTEAAMRLEEPVRRNIEAFDRLTAPSVFVPEAVERRIVIASCGAVFPEVIERVASELFARAPRLKLTLLHRTPHLWEDLHEGAVDMALVSGFSLPPGLRKMLLFRSPAGIVVRRDHPLARLGRAIAPAEAGAYPRLTVLVNSDAGRPTYERVLTGGADRSRRDEEAALTAESVYDILPVLETTDAVLFAPETAGRVSARHYAVVWVPFETAAERFGTSELSGGLPAAMHESGE